MTTSETALKTEFNGRPVVLVIMDGWGIRPEQGVMPGDATKLAKPSFYEHLLANYPWIPIEASGLMVGLPEGQMGNSEVGHMNMGAGRVIYQEITRIDKSIDDGDFYQNPVFLAACAHAKQHQGALHLMGLLSDGGVHSSLEHLLALLDVANEQSVDRVHVHAFLDGRDVPPRSAETYLRQLEERLIELEYPQIATICGRYYAMDRDNRWERVEQAYNAIVAGEGSHHFLSIDALKMAYHNDMSDEFVKPAITDFTFDGVQDGDSILFFNFRPDRARELTHAMTDPEFSLFERKRCLNNVYFGCMSPYDDRFTLPIAFPKDKLDQTLASIVSEHGIRQFHTAETEKYAHVTFFFNGGVEPPFPGEDRRLVASPQVATYDLQPEMSLNGVTEAICEALETKQYGLIVANFANPDMVGHTGKLPAALEAVTAVDHGLEQVVQSVLTHNGLMLLTADHGNIEMMIAEDGGEHTAHTTDKVPLVLIGESLPFCLNETQAYGLSSIAPTVLQLLGLPIPGIMTSPSTLVPQPAPVSAEA